MYVAKFIDKYYPAVIIKFTKTCGNASQEEFDAYLQKFAELYERKEKFNILLDCRAADSFPVSYAIQHATFLIKYKIQTEKYIKKSAILLTNPTLKKILDVVFSIYTPKSDLIITENFREALIHVLDQQDNTKDDKSMEQLITEQPQEQEQA
jgi:hypothetical protein